MPPPVPAHCKAKHRKTHRCRGRQQQLLLHGKGRASSGGTVGGVAARSIHLVPLSLVPPLPAKSAPVVGSGPDPESRSAPKTLAAGLRSPRPIRSTARLGPSYRLTSPRNRAASSLSLSRRFFPGGAALFVGPFAGEGHPPGKMINLFKIKGQKKDAAANTNGKPAAKKQSPGELRLHKDIAELNLPKTTKITFPNGKDDLMNFEATIKPDEGYYMGGKFVFTFQVPPAYPHEPPKVKCKTKVYHPNIDLEGNVCLNILREDWKPVLNVNTIVYGLNLLFSQPNDEDPLNHDAAAVLRDDPKKFEINVRRAMAGGYVGETHFPRCI